MTILREIQSKIEQSLFPGGIKQAVIVIYGARQVGKTTLVKNLLEKFPQKAAYYNCDYFDVQQLFSWENIDQIGNEIKNTRLLVLDEAQRIMNIGLTLKILVDEHPGIQVIATGSSSFELSNRINEPLTGRKKVFQLYPFSLKEISANKRSLEIKRMIPQKLRYGMYPGLLDLNNDACEIHLKELYSNYLYKDIFNFQQIKKPESLDKLLRLLAFQIGHEVSYNELAINTGVDQSVIQRYLQLLEESFIIFRLSAYKKNLRSEVSKSRKIYFWDLGIRNAIIQNFNPPELRDDKGSLWENFCVAERLKSLSNQQIMHNSFFWRTYQQKEIDYIEEAKGKISAWEFKWSSLKKTRIPKKFAETYPNCPYKVISPDHFEGFLP